MRSLAQCLVHAFWLNPLVRVYFLFRYPPAINYRTWILGGLAFQAIVIGLLLAKTDGSMMLKLQNSLLDYPS